MRLPRLTTRRLMKLSACLAILFWARIELPKHSSLVRTGFACLALMTWLAVARFSQEPDPQSPE
jgi:hypothetical protein